MLMASPTPPTISQRRGRTPALIAWVMLAACSVPIGAEPLFIDETESSGLAFEHFNGMSGELYFPEMMGSGAARR
jgi:hypothetical protein